MGLHLPFLAQKPSMRRLLGAGFAMPSMLTTRSQASGAMATSLYGSTWVEYQADTPRFHGAERWFLMEPQRTNAIRNPRMEGTTLGVIGSGGVIPTNMAVISSGLNAEVLAVTKTDGVDVLRLRLYGTASAALWSLQWDTNTGIDALPSQTWTSSIFIKQLAAPQPPMNYRQRVVSRNSGGTSIGVHNLPTFSGPASLTRVVDTQVLGSDVGIAKVSSNLSITLTSGAAYDFTFEVGWPQMENSATVSTPILPAVGTPAASTRGLDLMSGPLSALGAPDSARGVWYGSYILDGVQTGTAQYMLNLDNNTNGANNRISLIQNAGNTNTVGSGGGVNTSNMKAAVAGERVFFGISVQGDGNVAYYTVGGVAMRYLTGAPASGLLSARIGNSGGSPTNTAAGRYPNLRYLRTPLPEAGLVSLVDSFAAAA